MFIAKWSPEWLAFDSGQSKTEPKPDRLLDDRSLVKWETSGPTIKVGSREMSNEVGRKVFSIARELVRIANGGEFTGDRLSRLYFVWANLYGVTEQAFDDMRLVVQVGGDAEEALDVARGRGLFMVDGPTCRLALLADRLDRPHLGEDDASPLIDQLHRAMLHWQRGDRAAFVQYLHTRDLAEHAGYWRLAQALFEVLLRDRDDWRLASALLAERPTLRTEIKLREAALTPARERTLFDDAG